MKATNPTIRCLFWPRCRLLFFVTHSKAWSAALCIGVKIFVRKDNDLIPQFGLWFNLGQVFAWLALSNMQTLVPTRGHLVTTRKPYEDWNEALTMPSIVDFWTFWTGMMGHDNEAFSSCIIADRLGEFHLLVARWTVDLRDAVHGYFIPRWFPP